jgi:catechol 2,3-dioxygenase-like lactoylglutathione lyase family enzyme
MNQSIVHVALVVRDYDEAIRFFVETLRFTLVEDTYQPEQDKRWVLVRPPGSEGPSILLARATNPEQERAIGNQTGGRVFLFLSTDDFWRDYNRMVSSGVTFVRPPSEMSYGTVAVFEDLYGNRWDLVQYSPSSAEKPMNDDVAETIIAMERAALERWGRGDPSGFLEISADDVVYFDPYQERRLNGIAELRDLYESIRGQVSIARFELIAPLVQVSGDMAVLTFNYVAEGTNEVTSRWNCTEVYRRAGSTWRIVQTHWSVTRPELR